MSYVDLLTIQVVLCRFKYFHVNSSTFMSYVDLLTIQVLLCKFKYFY
jgi:hypothetical protein